MGYQVSLRTQTTSYMPLVIGALSAHRGGHCSGCADAPPAPTPPPHATATPTAHSQPFVIEDIQEPNGIAVDPDHHRLYVTSRNADQVYEIDVLATTISKTIPVGAQPFGAALDTGTGKLYVANFGGNSVSVIDTAGGMVSSTISLFPLENRPSLRSIQFPAAPTCLYIAMGASPSSTRHMTRSSTPSKWVPALSG